MGFPGGTSGKELACQCRRHERRKFYTWVGKIPWRRACQPTAVLLPGESHGQRSLAGYSPWGWRRVRQDCVTKHTKAFWTMVLGSNPLKGIENESCEAALSYICEFFHWNIWPAGRSQTFYMEFCLLFSFVQQNLFCPISQFMQKVYKK